MKQHVFKIQGMDCAEEAALLRRALSPLLEDERDLSFDVLHAKMILTGDRYSANLVLPGDQTTGTFSVSPLLSVFNAAQSVIAVGGVLIDSQGAAEENTAGTEERPLITALLPVHLYDQVSSGRVTLLSIAPISGAFEFTAADENGRTVTVRAVFAELSEEIDSP